jgi:hypothetical protein
MTNKQESVEKMSLSSVSFLNANATITATIPGYSTYFPIVVTTNGQIQTAKVQQENDESGNITAKNQIRATLITQTLDVIRKTVAYATVVNNSVLLTQVKYTDSSVNKSSDSNLTSIAQVVHDAANANAAALVAYGVTAANITTLQATITSFVAAIPKARIGTTDGGEATKLLATLFKTLTDTWDKIDTLIEVVKISQPNFYNEYHDVRKVISTGTGSYALQASAKELNSGDPVAKATFTFSPAATLLKSAVANVKDNIVKKTAAKGKFNIKSMPEGTYTVTITKPGYKDQVVTVSVVSGELAKLDVVLEKA